jgi:hypothetical protein
VREQYLALAQNIPVPDADLLELASARAIAVKSYLVNEAGLSPDRAIIASPDIESGANLYSGVALDINI